MEFNIRKGSTLPFIEVNLIKDGSTDYNYVGTNLTGSTIYFYMKDFESGVYKVSNSLCTYSINTNSIYYQFTKKNTSKVGRYIGGFKIYTDQGLVDLPIKNNIYINVLESISDSDFCCGPNKNIAPIVTPTPITPTPITPTPTNPPPTPTPMPNTNAIYYGKFSGTSITSGQVVSNLTLLYTNSAVNSYVNVPYGSGYSYILIPTGFVQPSNFVNSTNGCDGLTVPMNNIGQIIINDVYGTPITYNVYRSYYNVTGQLNIWMCN
jgi:hypothetical protein